MKNKGFVFIETIIVICVLTVALITLYNNYSKIVANTKELNTFDTTEYNYKTYYLMKEYNVVYLTDGKCIERDSGFSDDGKVKICKFGNILEDETKTVKEYINTNKSDMDAYIIDYLLKQDLNENNDNLYLVEYKKKDKQNPDKYFTYISSLTY